ncbi:Rab proteins geranylgeranyltransferase component A [Onygenales sp. PD_12]|nr:Rab proteins geranylgeranyltransferase component A [Onygenales sp. PD_12]KAK2800402.1 Rab proteins geranylgeranyltransferase component A [Onygenales sp. PD_10]
MEQLTDVVWDVLIAGTGLPQALLALALSRSGKKVLHVDKHDYYGGSEAAFSLQEADAWVKQINEAPGSAPFESVSISSSPSDDGGKLSPSRAYTLSLSPQLIYSRSRLIPSLISSRSYKQLEFQAVGSWWVYREANASLNRVPGSREDVFADDSMSNKSKRSLMKFLRHLAQPPPEDGSEEEEKIETPFSQYLESKFQVPSELHDPLISLALSLHSPDQASGDYAVPRIKRHLTSIGVFGAGFGSLLAKWGGGAEISQVGCRSCAVGGGVYVLDRGVSHIDAPVDQLLQVRLADGETVRSKFVVGSPWDLPSDAQRSTNPYTRVTKSIMIVSSPLDGLFPPTSEGGPIPAGAVVFIPGASASTDQPVHPPVYLIVHSSDTGECPTGQCVIYATTLLQDDGHLIESATTQFLASVDADAKILWTLRYTQLGILDEASCAPSEPSTTSPSLLHGQWEQIFCFPPPTLDLAFDDGMLDQVRAVWEAVTDGDEERGEFLQFEDREAGESEEQIN